MANPIALEAAARHMERAAAVVHHRMKRNLRALAVVAYVAPMVGLLGTCAGIVNAFRGRSSSMMRAIFGGLSEGFVPFALGLAVGLPAFWAYRHLTRYADEFEVEMTRTSARIIRYLEELR